MVGRRPVAVAVEQGSENATVDDSVEGLVVRLRPPLGHDLLAGLRDEALDTQALLIGRPASEAAVPGGVSVLEAFHGKRLQESGRGPITI